MSDLDTLVFFSRLIINVYLNRSHASLHMITNTNTYISIYIFPHLTAVRL